MEIVSLRAGALSLGLAPAVGGALAYWTRDDQPILRPVSDPDLVAQHARQLGGYPLLPFSNRVAWGRFSLGGVGYQLARNFGDHPHTIHGNGWMRAWQVAERDAASALLVLRHDPPRDPGSEWPFPYEASEFYRLSEAALDVTLSLRNLADRPVPVGLGLHPYFPRTPDLTLQFEASSVWQTGDDSLPRTRLPVEGAWDFHAARPLVGCDLDNCYNGWRGIARLTWPSRSLQLEISADDLFQHLVVFVPPNKGFVAVEPASNMTDAINRMGVPDHGLRMVAPGETLSGSMRFGVNPI